MKIIVGLGNPGREYMETRHNAGFHFLDELAYGTGIKMDEKKHYAICGKGRIENETVLLMKPQTYMNRSGESVRSAVDFYKLSIEDIIIVFDDVSLPPGQLRIRKKGSAGGHNGVKSIIAHLESMDFLRIKIGVGEKPEGYDLANYVLGRFSRGEKELLRSAYENAAEAIKLIIAGKSEQAMNTYNKKIKFEAVE